MDADTKYFQTLALFARTNNHARRLPAEPAFIDNENYLQIPLPSSSPTSSENSSEDGHSDNNTVSEWHKMRDTESESEMEPQRSEQEETDDWDLVSEWSRLAQAQVSFQDPRQERVRKPDSDVHKPALAQQKLQLAEEAFQRQTQESKTLRRLRRENEMLRKALVITCGIICLGVLLFLF
ncbi:hypothetical protein SBOR_0887 [Sclerotinia borealis F-4128]|uniref:Uncharacterized protein n=1 Tax=Sclerotinia borealis (strain F-4128) TaxID=1432307 RepID=W9CVL3_SCLBF|nr:hypothetical protein SBOR_0887 [Sclerotinia borealis F-4128]